MSIRAIYENGVFKPLEDVTVKEGTEVEVYPIGEQKENGGKRPRLEDLEVYGMWEDRTDFKDGEDYVNQIRKYRK